MATVPFPLLSDRSGSTPPRCFRLAFKTLRGRPRPLRPCPPPPAPHLCSGHGELAVVRGRTRSPQARIARPARATGAGRLAHATCAPGSCRVSSRRPPPPALSRCLPPPPSPRSASPGRRLCCVILDSSTAPGDKRTRRLFPDGAVDLGNSERPPRRRRERSTLSNRGPRLFLFLHSVGLWFPQCVPD